MSEEGDKDKKISCGNELSHDDSKRESDSLMEREMKLKLDEIDALKRENEELKGRAKRELNNLNARLGEDIDRYKRAADKSRKKSDELIENLDAEKVKVSQLTKELEDSRGEIDRYKSSEVLLNSQLMEMKSELDSKSEEIERIENEMKSRGAHLLPPPHRLSQLQHHSADGAAASAAVAAELPLYPFVYVSLSGTITCMLNQGVIVEMTVDRNVRIVLHGYFAAFCNARGTSSAIYHTSARIMHVEEYVNTKFIANNEKMAVLDERGVLFTMSHLSEAYLVNSAARPGALLIAHEEFPALDGDFTNNMFYSDAQWGQDVIGLCKDIVNTAVYERRSDGSLYVQINGMTILQTAAGEVIIDARPRLISCSPSNKTIHVTSECIDMAVEEDECGYVKRDSRCVRVAPSGMAVSDGDCFTSMDHSGRIVCCI